MSHPADAFKCVDDLIQAILSSHKEIKRVSRGALAEAEYSNNLHQHGQINQWEHQDCLQEIFSKFWDTIENEHTKKGWSATETVKVKTLMMHYFGRNGSSSER